jgi:hypothetical protein
MLLAGLRSIRAISASTAALPSSARGMAMHRIVALW